VQGVGKLPVEGVTLMQRIAIMTVGVLSGALVLTGCADSNKVPVQPVSIIGSDYCQISKKLSWDIKDTRPTIDGVRRHNAAWDAKCGREAKPTS
jgi:outer membrane murein-binding lipoprotein Lpp